MVEELSKCLLCGDSRLKKDIYAAHILNLASPHSITICQSCSFRFLNPRPSPAEYQQAYTKGSGALTESYEFGNEFYENENKIRISQYHKKLDLLTKAGAKGRLLEIGSCTGVFLNEAKKRAFEVEGIEPSEPNSQIAKQQYGLNLHVGKVEDFNFTKNSFDVIFSSHVFEHLLNPLTVARQLSSWLRQGGFHMIEVPNQFCTFEFTRRRLLRYGSPKNRSFRSIHHTVFFSPRTLRRLVQLSGCRQYSMRNVNYSSKNIFLNPKLAARNFMAKFFGGSNIEIIAQKC